MISSTGAEPTLDMYKRHHLQIWYQRQRMHFLHEGIANALRSATSQSPVTFPFRQGSSACICKSLAGSLWLVLSLLSLFSSSWDWLQKEGLSAINQVSVRRKQPNEHLPKCLALTCSSTTNLPTNVALMLLFFPPSLLHIPTIQQHRSSLANLPSAVGST